MSRRDQTSKYFRGPFAAIPVDVMKSEAWHWLPPFARLTLLALAGNCRETTNGALDLPTSEAGEYGLSPDQVSYGLRLCVTAGFLIKTANARGRSGQGKPAKYLITWFRNLEFPAYNLLEAEPRDNWKRFTLPCPPIKSLNQARRFCGNKATTAGRYTTPPGGEVLEATPAATSTKRNGADTATLKRRIKTDSATQVCQTRPRREKRVNAGEGGHVPQESN